MTDSVTFVGMDTHKKEHSIAVHFPGQEEILRFAVRNTAADISKMVKKIIRQSPGEVRFCYEAGVCGFTLKRRIEANDNCKCAVIAPSLTPRKPGERIKTDRRDALKLLSLFKAGLLTEVYAPNPEQEAARELTRCRQTAQENLKRVRHQLLKLLIRHGYIYTEGSHWTQKHIQWMQSLQFEQGILTEIFDSYFTEMNHCLQRLSTLDARVKKLAESEPYKEIVALLRCFRGIDTLTAITTVTEIFEFGRFASPRELGSYLGLTSSESSSGEKRKKGSITKTGNNRIRRLFTEAAWHYPPPIRLSKALCARRKGQPQWAINIADRAAERLRKRYWHLINHGKPPCVAVIAIARELAGFIWSVLNEYQIRNQQKTA